MLPVNKQRAHPCKWERSAYATMRRGVRTSHAQHQDARPVGGHREHGAVGRQRQLRGHEAHMLIAHGVQVDLAALGRGFNVKQAQAARVAQRHDRRAAARQQLHILHRRRVGLRAGLPEHLRARTRLPLCSSSHRSPYLAVQRSDGDQGMQAWPQAEPRGIQQPAFMWERSLLDEPNIWRSSRRTCRRTRGACPAGQGALAPGGDEARALRQPAHAHAVLGVRAHSLQQLAAARIQQRHAAIHGCCQQAPASWAAAHAACRVC